ncbi:MAG: cbb3-type cytochrome oxidase assembly protein CcoS [Cellvibrionaceae bacterium]
MEMLYLLIPVALFLLVLAIKFLFWAINSGQYDDLETEGQRILFEDDSEQIPNNTISTSTSSQAVDKTDSIPK